MAKDGGGELQPEQDGEPRREQPAEVEVLPALGHHGRAREARERNGSPHKRCHQDAEKYVHQKQTGKPRQYTVQKDKCLLRVGSNRVQSQISASIAL